MIAVAGAMFASCEPQLIKGPEAAAAGDAASLKSAFVIDGQFADAACETAQADGNYIKYHTSPATTVQVYTLKDDGTKNVLATGASGVFNITPKRGNPSTQNYTVATIYQDATVVSFDSTIEVYVPSELDPAVKLLAGDTGSKAWKWYAIDGACWGNAGYIGDAGHGANVAAGEVPGKWWGCAPAADESDVDGTFLDQLAHSGNVDYGDVYKGSYMVFDEDGNIKSYKPDGTEIRGGSYTITGLDQSGDVYPYATLTTSEPAILFPFAINTGGETMSEFEVAYIDDNLLTLIGNYAGSAAWAWAECTWWRFKNASDAEAALSAYDERAWTYYSIDDACWGNAGYIGAPGQADFASGEVPGKWWGCLPEDLEDGQIAHSGGVAYGYGSSDAYMVFDYETGLVTTYDANGSEITSEGYTVSYDWTVDGYTDAGDPAGTLTGSVLYPFAINTGGAQVDEYQLVYIDGQTLILINNYNEAAQWAWGECTWWRFKPVQ